jgi:hypothetical protein
VGRVVAGIANKKPGGSKPGERRGGRQVGTPNKTTAIISAVMDAVANGSAGPEISPLQFLLGVYRDPKVDPRLRLDSAKAAAPFVHAKPIGAPALDSGPIIDMLAGGDRAQVEKDLARLRQLELKDLLGDVLSATERAELKRLRAWSDTLLPHLLGLEPADIELRALMADTPWGPTPEQARAHQDPAEERARIKAKLAGPAEVRATTLAEPAEEGKVPLPMDDDDAIEGLG